MTEGLSLFTPKKVNYFANQCLAKQRSEVKKWGSRRYRLLTVKIVSNIYYTKQGI